MSTRLAPALNIDTNFLADEYRGKTLTEIYTGTDALVDNSTLSLVLQTNDYSELREKKFDEMAATDITAFVDAQLKEVRVDTAGDPVNASGEVIEIDSNDVVFDDIYDPLSYDTQVLRNDIISWVLERRMNDINDKLEKDKEIFDITEAVIDAVPCLAEGWVSAQDIRGDIGFLGSRSEKSVLGYYPRSEISTETKKDMEAMIEAIKQTVKAAAAENDKSIRFTSYENIFGEEQPVPVGLYFGEDANSDFNKAIVKPTGRIQFHLITFDHKGSAFGDLKLYHCNLNYRPHDHDEIFIGYNELASHLFRYPADAATASLLVLAKHLEDILLDNTSNQFEWFNLFAKLAKDAVMPILRTSYDYHHNNDIRELARAADLNGNVATVKEGALSYIQGGYYIDENNAVTEIKDENA